MNTRKIIIIAAVVDVHNLTLYTETGETLIIPQGDPRVRKIVTEATPQLLEQGWAEVDVAEVQGENHYAEFEKKSGGVVQFFRVAKDKIKHMFGDDTPVVADTRPVPALSIGQVPTPVVASATPVSDHIATAGIYDVSEADEVVAAQEQADQKGPGFFTPEVKQTMAAVNEIMKHAIPVSSVEFNEKGLAKQGNVVEDNGHTDNQCGQKDTSTDTIIAVVDGKVIPGMEKIKTQFSRAAKLGSTTGVENFLKRLGAVIEKRSHSIEDLLKFMERGDLPIADDGSILIYKVLKFNGDRTNGKYVDCHTKKVEQWTGAYVCMDEKLVDPNRRNECSNGLHVARRGYVHGFSGDVCVLAKLAPEDVIAVPEHDANKMRVCGYHIIMELSQKQYDLLKKNQPITSDDEGKHLLACALSGKHIHRTHEVRITESKGGGVKVTKLRGLDVVAAPIPEAKKVEVPVAEMTALENPDKEKKDVTLLPTEVVKQVDVVKEVQQASKKEQAKVLYDACAGGGQAALDALKAFKKESKKSWEALGLPELNGSTFSLRPENKGTAAVAVPAKKTVVPSGKSYAKKAKKIAKAKADLSAPSKRVVDTIAARATHVAKVVEANQGGGSPRDRINKLRAIGVKEKGIAESILKIKKESKKSWEYFGMNGDDLAYLLKLAGK
jgi:hypothetical protein